MPSPEQYDHQAWMRRFVARLEGMLSEPARRRYLRANEWPQRLYRYMPLTEERAPHLRDILVNSLLYLASPKDFNDPFDCRLSQRFDGTREQRLAGLERLAARTQPDKPPQWRAAWARRVLHNADKINPFSGILNVMEHAGISCFAGDPRNLLLWAHYASSHRGVCLVFDRVKSLDPLVATMKVQYRDHFPVLNYATDDDKATLDAYNASILSKGKVWEYEREERIVIPDASGKRLRFRPEALTAVILGTAAGAREDQFLIDLLEERKRVGHPRPRVYRAHVCTNAHRVRIFKTSRGPGLCDLPRCRL